jgi:cytochrome c-type biogenesis protein CcmH/NrfF
MNGLRPTSQHDDSQREQSDSSQNSLIYSNRLDFGIILIIFSVLIVIASIFVETPNGLDPPYTAIIEILTIASYICPICIMVKKRHIVKSATLPLVILSVGLMIWRTDWLIRGWSSDAENGWPTNVDVLLDGMIVFGVGILLTNSNSKKFKFVSILKFSNTYIFGKVMVIVSVILLFLSRHIFEINNSVGEYQAKDPGYIDKIVKTNGKFTVFDIHDKMFNQISEILLLMAIIIFVIGYVMMQIFYRKTSISEVLANEDKQIGYVSAKNNSEFSLEKSSLSPSEPLRKAVRKRRKGPLKSGTKSLWIGPIALVLVAASGLGWYGFRQGEEKKVESEMKRNEELHIQQQAQLRQQRMQLAASARPVIQVMIRQIDSIAGRIRNITIDESKTDAFNNTSDSDLLTVDPRSGEFTSMGELKSSNSEKKAELLSVLNNRINTVLKIANDNYVPNGEIQRYLAGYVQLLSNPNMGKSETIYAKPINQDVITLATYANQLREAIRQTPRRIPNGDPRYNQVMNNAAVKMVGPVARQFNTQCQKFVGLYGKDNLIQVARENNFIDLIQ